jgi:Family of unknown function (DUF5995)
MTDLPAIDGLIETMTALLAPLRQRRDPRRFFLATYLRTTEAVRAELSAGGFEDRAWVERWDVAFAQFYLDALKADLAHIAVPGPWAAAFAAAGTGDRVVPPLQHVLLGMNAHINYDLPQALLAVISDSEFDDAALMARRAADHRHIDQVLGVLVDRRDGLPDAPASGPTVADRLLAPANRLATKRFLTEARAKVWANTRVLAGARRKGSAAYSDRLAELERLSAARVADLTRPGNVLLRLAARGFGVRLPPEPGPATRGTYRHHEKGDQR